MTLRDRLTQIVEARLTGVATPGEISSLVEDLLTYITNRDGVRERAAIQRNYGGQ